MIRDFETWNNNIGESANLSDLKDTQVGIEAADYLLHHIINHPHGREPLVAALGGVHHGLRQHVEDDLNVFKFFQIQPLFVFSGIDVPARHDDPFRQRTEGAMVNGNAWSLYDNHQAEQSVLKFGESPYVIPEDLFRAFQQILFENDVQFLVAPYSSWAQLAELERQKSVSAIAGSSEIFLFECDKLITSWDFPAKTFRFISKAKCIADLEKYGNGTKVSEDIFVDACLLAGVSYLNTIPNLEAPSRNKAIKPHGAIDLINNGGRTGYQVVLNNQDDPKLRSMKYPEKYRLARMAIKHMPIITVDGNVAPLHEDSVPKDAHEFISQRLPNEIHHYHSRGLINSRVLSWRVYSEIIEPPPVDGGDSQAYQDLVGSLLSPLRTTTLTLLSTPLHNWYTHKNLTLKCWFPGSDGKPHTSTISTGPAKEMSRIVESWNVKEATFKDAVAAHKTSGPLGAAILALQDADFVSRSNGSKDPKNVSYKWIENSLQFTDILSSSRR
ncbi:PIN domain-like protein [Dendryphion nanum]|uniref:PIN domain-like protein n=1 Tax=Dendryphion nanum TaxID=256645 RepID=A0A9P9EJZ5_9PLEO|nr:PIN domain-like protein [Dendryphion nanum]